MSNHTLLFPVIRLRPSTTPALSTSTPSPATTPLPATPTVLTPSPPSTPPPSSSIHPPPSPSSVSSLSNRSVSSQLHDCFDQAWVQSPGTTAEILFIKRATRATDKWSGHIAFPGGRQEPEDEDGRYTAMRETWEGALSFISIFLGLRAVKMLMFLHLGKSRGWT